jgi:hypothetical protein
MFPNTINEPFRLEYHLTATHEQGQVNAVIQKKKFVKIIEFSWKLNVKNK